MLNRTQFTGRFSSGTHLLDGATGTELRKAGMPDNCCGEQWILDRPEALVTLQRAYAEAGSEVIYAPTFRAQPLALRRWGLETETEKMNRELLALSRTAAPDCIIAGNLTTAQGCGTEDPAAMKEAYRTQIKALTDGGADILAAETLMNTAEAEMILEAAAELSAPPVMISFTCRNGQELYSGEKITDALRAAEKAGACAAGINCVNAAETLPELIAELKEWISIPLLCKPNAGYPANGKYPVDAVRFAAILLACAERGANLIGGCCGTTPEYIRRVRELLPLCIEEAGIK